MGFRITTWNVNGIRNPFSYQPWSQNRAYDAMFSILESDIVVLQECKIQRKDLTDEMVLVPGWDAYFSLPLHKKGYAGVAIYTRTSRCAPLHAEEGLTGVLPSPAGPPYHALPNAIGGYPTASQLCCLADAGLDAAALDAEGRCVLLQFPGFVLMGVYAPAQRDAARAGFREAFFAVLDTRVRNLRALGHEVVLVGDLNVSRDVRDSCGVVEALRREGVGVTEFMAAAVRRGFNQMVFNGRVDGPRDVGREQPVLWDECRERWAERDGMYTCWDTRRNTRPANNGSRIDYVLCSSGVHAWVVAADIQPGLMGSDHCPVFLELGARVQCNGVERRIEELVNPAGRVDARTGEIKTWTLKDACGLSARLMPEFAGRRNIRDMFLRGSKKTGIGKGDVQSAGTGAYEAPQTDEKEAGKRGSAAAPAVKRPAASAAFAAPTAKKARASPKKTGVLDARQNTLRGFLKPRASGGGPSTSSPREETTETRAITEASTRAKESTNANPAVTIDNERVFDPIQAKESWTGLLGKRTVPLCEHDEPCMSLRTKKPGVNLGRSFFMCARPLGPSGEKEKGTEWRCATFIWSTDWGRQQN
ncbi:hypothetical protein TD95_003138 [Thielaviopsis punctulata]|uniref:DNA-(apurinic or apyrimidinic site) endonuclease 2 n=1 Tax=Thielaviopsis punctulata TaxID=72032 RepID=A0A0F4ZAY0_9PEZI|nr:hypothetical protein TD95_003138 [Thielaviopsis punctulata]DAB41617.1 TPA_exp: AP endonuclease 2 [Thielaviopsis punctulata]